MKLNFIFLVAGILSGGALVYKLSPKPAPQIITKTDVKTKVVKVTEPSGKIIETTEQVSSVNNSVAETKKNSAILFRDEINYKRKIYEFEKFDLGAVVKARQDRAEIGIGIDW